jgi:hypothetical protein
MEVFGRPHFEMPSHLRRWLEYPEVRIMLFSPLGHAVTDRRKTRGGAAPANYRHLSCCHSFWMILGPICIIFQGVSLSRLGDRGWSRNFQRVGGPPRVIQVKGKCRTGSQVCPGVCSPGGPPGYPLGSAPGVSRGGDRSTPGTPEISSSGPKNMALGFPVTPPSNQESKVDSDR